jgi:hypothetical protein
MAEKKPYNPKRPEFDAYDKNASRRRALGDENIKTIVRGGGIQSADYVPGVSGWILLPNGGLKLGNTSGLFPPGAVTFADIQNIATASPLGTLHQRIRLDRTNSNRLGPHAGRRRTLEPLLGSCRTRTLDKRRPRIPRTYLFQW